MENVNSVKKLAYDLAYFYEKEYGCCSQCVIGAIKNTIGSRISDDVFKSATGLGAGLAGAGICVRRTYRRDHGVKLFCRT